MLKNYLPLLLLAISCQAPACTVRYYSTSNVVKKVLRKEGWDFKDYERICAKLKKADAVLVVEGHATVLGARSIAWATVSFKDSNTMVFTNDHGGTSTRLDEYASMDRAEENLMDAINSAVDSANIDDALASLQESRKQVLAAYGRKYN